MVQPILPHWTLSLAEKSNKLSSPFKDLALSKFLTLTSQYLTPHSMCSSYLTPLMFQSPDSAALFVLLLSSKIPINPINHLHLGSTPTSAVWPGPISSTVGNNPFFHWLSGVFSCTWSQWLLSSVIYFNIFIVVFFTIMSLMIGRTCFVCTLHNALSTWVCSEALMIIQGMKECVNLCKKKNEEEICTNF